MPTPTVAPPEHRPPAVGRRQFLAGMATGAAAALIATRMPRAWAGGPSAATVDYPFTLGVASGDPHSGGFVTWTRLAPDPLGDGGMPAEPVTVRWQVALDEAFTVVVRHGVAAARPEHGHCVHVDVDGLLPDRWYWYRFEAMGQVSPAGRARTFPVGAVLPARLRLAVASCQHFEHGWYTAYRHMAAEDDLDLVLHLGDYIYEHAAGGSRVASGAVRSHVGGETISLADYRRRFAQYRTDPDLQAAHATTPFVVTWDDHEVDNNYAAGVPSGDPSGFDARRAAAYQAYWEHMPLAADRPPKGSSMRLYRRLTFGRLAELHVLDTRQYRSDHPCSERLPSDCPERHQPQRTMTGTAQERWLARGLAGSSSRWNVLAQQIFLAQVDALPGPARGFNVDAWDGATAARDRLFQLISEGVINPVVLTGDAHANWVADLRADFSDPASTVIGTEFVTTSISSNGDGTEITPWAEAILVDNPHLRFSNHRRGYLRCEITPEAWRTDFRLVPYVSRPGAPITTRASFVIEDGVPGVQSD